MTSKHTSRTDVSWYKSQADVIARAVFASLKALGELILEADKNLSNADYREFQNYLLHTWTKADLKAARAVATGEMDERLFPAGVRNSKVLSLPEVDQRRLLSSEKFQVWGADARPRTKTWAEMSPAEQNRLLGPKGGYIHALDDQKKPGSRGAPRTSVYTAARYDLVTGMISLNGSEAARGEILAARLRASMPADELAGLVAALTS